MAIKKPSLTMWGNMKHQHLICAKLTIGLAALAILASCQTLPRQVTSPNLSLDFRASPIPVMLNGTPPPGLVLTEASYTSGIKENAVTTYSTARATSGYGSSSSTSTVSTSSTIVIDTDIGAPLMSQVSPFLLLSPWAVYITRLNFAEAVSSSGLGKGEERSTLSITVEVAK